MPVEFQDYYQVLGVSPKATDEEIKRAFRTLARKYHPDVAKDKGTAEDKFKEINEANEVLSNPGSRKQYDLLGARWKQGPDPRPPANSPPHPRSGSPSGSTPDGQTHDFQFEGTGFSDFFEKFFGGRARRSHGGSTAFETDGTIPGDFQDYRESPPPLRGQDIEGDLLITLNEVLLGAMRSISVRRPNSRTGIEETETYQVRIPAGVSAGQTIRVAGKGGQGQGGGGFGDIHLRVRYAQHPDFTVRGADLVGQVELTPWEAVLGATVPVQTLDAAVSVKVPPSTQQGQQLRVRGKGLQAGAGRRGDLYAVVHIAIPPTVGKAEELLWRQLAGIATYNPRSTQ